MNDSEVFFGGIGKKQIHHSVQQEVVMEKRALWMVSLESTQNRILRRVQRYVLEENISKIYSR